MMAAIKSNFEFNPAQRPRTPAMQGSDTSALREKLRAYGGNNTLDYRHVAAAEIERLEAVLERVTAIAEDKLADTRLVSAGARGEIGFGFDLMGGPIPYITEYLFQFIGARDDDKPTSNYAEIEVSHHEFGAMTLTLQRRSGQTPHQLRQAAEARCDKLAEALAWYAEQTRLCRLIHSGGDAGRGALAEDGGKRAREALEQVGKR